MSKARAADSEQVKGPMKDSTPMARLESTDISAADSVINATSAGTEPVAETAVGDVGLPDAGNGEIHQSVAVCSIWSCHETEIDECTDL